MSHEGRIPSFVDPEAEQELNGFANDRFGMPRLPGTSWESGNMFDSGMAIPNCDMDSGVFHDTAWQFGYPSSLRTAERAGDAVLSELFYHNAVRRLQAVEQLTLPPEYSTVPNTGAFSRFEHVWGSALFVRQIAEAHGISPEETVRLQLRTLVSDVAHTFGSHLGDWMFQGIGGAENQHDIELAGYLEAVGVNDTLRKHGIDPRSVTFPEVADDWIEASQPDLCVDRVDYGLREMNRWNDVVRSQAFTAEDFTITPENMLAMTDRRRARIFAEGFLLLSQEHWSEPTHRFMEDMLILRTKLFYGEGRAPRSWVFEPDDDSIRLVNLAGIHPRDLMYVTDPAQTAAYQLPNLGGHILESIMTSVARYRRQYVWPGRRQRIARYMSQFADESSYEEVRKTGAYTSLDSSRFNSYLDEYPPTLPGGFALLDPEVAESTMTDASIDLPQPPFKIRQIDPLVRVGSDYKRLSVLDPSYVARLQEHRRKLQQQKVARLVIADPTTCASVKAIVQNVESLWQTRLATSERMTPAQLRELVSTSSMEVHGAYPFLSFFEFE